MKKLFIIILLLTTCHLSHAHISDSTRSYAPYRKYYTGNSFDAGIFSVGLNNTPAPGTTNVVRFSYFFNGGATFNFNPSQHFGWFTGVDIKNIGFIEHNAGVTTKRRAYTLGVPLGIKLGNMAHHGIYGFFGGGLDLPFNYKEKSFVKRSNKTKFNEWFSDRTSVVMPYAFAGIKTRRGVTFKVQYYFNNFLNPSFADKNGLKVYSGYDVHLLMFSLGYTTGGKKDKKSIGLKDLQK